MQKSKKAFTMIELVFVIVVLGILAAVAIPRFAATRTDAEITKGRADIASIRSAIVTERQARLITGDSLFIAAGNGAGLLDNNGLFGGVLTYPIADRVANGRWTNLTRPDVNSSTYNYQINNVTTTFTYTRDGGIFDCVANTDDCNALTD
ncbi:MAG: type II secretion system GspH family protein [Sulfurimonas sp.]|nr:type II secretion system GspH family protein [Sulfurimonas sp.]